jgi:hypothetical protein
MVNVWSALLSGLLWFINAVIMPLFGDASSQRASLDLAQMMASNAGVLFQLIFVSFGSVFNLTLFAILMALTFLIKGGQIIVSIWLFIKSLIPAA